MAPHVFVEDISIASIAAAKRAFETTDLPQKLARHHRDPGKTFLRLERRMARARVSELEHRELLPAITCPLLVIQGRTTSMAHGAGGRDRAPDGGPVEVLKLEHCGHTRRRPSEIVAGAIVEFVKRCSGEVPRSDPARALLLMPFASKVRWGRRAGSAGRG